MTVPRPILIAGPTASGKSALALAIAERVGGVIINADSMQVYRELRILTARPGPEDEARAPHKLYGQVGAAESYSVARWLDDARREIDLANGSGARPIVVGGTGLYFKALTEGLSPVPPIPDAIRAYWRDLLARDGVAEAYRLLAERDAGMAERLRPSDGQRIVRALEVHEATGRSLAEWQRQPGIPVVREADAIRLAVEMPREELFQRCDRRFDQMMAAGGLEEVRALGRLGLDARLPAMRALGVPSLLEHLAGRIDLAAAVAAAKQQTRRYVRRQQTWLKRHMISWNCVQLSQSVVLSSMFDQLID